MNFFDKNLSIENARKNAKIEKNLICPKLNCKFMKKNAKNTKNIEKNIKILSKNLFFLKI